MVELRWQLLPCAIVHLAEAACGGLLLSVVFIYSLARIWGTPHARCSEYRDMQVILRQETLRASRKRVGGQSSKHALA